MGTMYESWEDGEDADETTLSTPGERFLQRILGTDKDSTASQFSRLITEPSSATTASPVTTTDKSKDPPKDSVPKFNLSKLTPSTPSAPPLTSLPSPSSAKFDTPQTTFTPPTFQFEFSSAPTVTPSTPAPSNGGQPSWHYQSHGVSVLPSARPALYEAKLRESQLGTSTYSTRGTGLSVTELDKPLPPIQSSAFPPSYTPLYPTTTSTTPLDGISPTAAPAPPPARQTFHISDPPAPNGLSHRADAVRDYETKPKSTYSNGVSNGGTGTRPSAIPPPRRSVSSPRTATPSVTSSERPGYLRSHSQSSLRLLDGPELDQRRKQFLKSTGPSTTSGGVDPNIVRAQIVPPPSGRRVEKELKADFPPPFPKPSVGEIVGSDISGRPSVMGSKPKLGIQPAPLLNGEISDHNDKILIIREFQKKLEEATARIDNLVRENRALENELRRLERSTHDDSHSASENLRRLQDEAFSLQSENSRLRDEVAHLRANPVTVQDEAQIRLLRERLEAQERHMGMTQTQAQRELEALSTDNQRLREALSATQRDMSALQAQLEGERSVLRDSALKATAAEDELRRQVRGYADRCDQAERYVSQLRNELEAAQRRARQLEADVEDSRQQGQRRAGEAEADARRKMEALEVELAQRMAAVEKDAAARVAQKDSLVSQLRGDLEAAQQSRVAALGDAERAFAAKEAQYQRTIADLNRRIEEMSEEIRRLQRLVEEKDAEIARLRDQLAQSQRRIAELEEMLETKTRDLRRANEDMEATVAGLRRALADKDNEMKAKDESVDQMKAYVRDAEERMRQMQFEIDQFHSIRRKMHNNIQELKGNIRVFCRVRPPLQRFLEAGDSGREVFRFVPGMTEDGQEVLEIMVHPDMGGRKERHSLVPGQERMRQYRFAFDRVFKGINQRDIFDEISELVQSVLDGYRVCIFAYGQTGSGKTYTMEGESRTDPELRGIIPRSIEQIFACTESLRARLGWAFTMHCSFIEIYNEELRDLLNPNPSPRGDDRLQIHHSGGHTSVPGVTVVEVTNPRQVFVLLDRANAARAIAETRMNDRSSRSHSVFKLEITGQCAKTGESMHGILNLVDLAGSERLSVSGSVGSRMKEAQNINKSLCSLADVISALANKDQHIPYRNSKLTYLLQESLGGDCKMLMFANIACEPVFAAESLCTLRFADKVNSTHIGTATKTARVNLSKVLEQSYEELAMEGQ